MYTGARRIAHGLPRTYGKLNNMDYGERGRGINAVGDAKITAALHRK